MLGTGLGVSGRAWDAALSAVPPALGCIVVGALVMSGSSRGQDGGRPRRLPRVWRAAVIIAGATALGGFQVEEEVALPVLLLCYAVTRLPLPERGNAS